MNKPISSKKERSFFNSEGFTIPDGLWEQIEPFLPLPGVYPKGGKPPINNRQIMTAILFVMVTGCQWKALPRTLAAPSTAHDRFQKWEQDGIFSCLWEAGLLRYDNRVGIAWQWQSADGCMTKAPLGGEQTGPNPTDRAKKGTKRSLLTDARGAPLGIIAAGANCHDKTLLAATLESRPLSQPPPSVTPHLCLDKAYDAQDIRAMLRGLGFVPHVKTRGQEAEQKAHHPRYRARRWVVERTHSWMNRFRRILIRWEKKLANYLAFLHIACAIIIFRLAEVSG